MEKTRGIVKRWITCAICMMMVLGWTVCTGTDSGTGSSSSNYAGNHCSGNHTGTK
ncbi:MAG: hypothetical protein PUC55_12385 [Lachnospiraceae bacterium]|nr:hypothetical protein [Lachnospiraceae bacterium]